MSRKPTVTSPEPWRAEVPPLPEGWTWAAPNEVIGPGEGMYATLNLRVDQDRLLVDMADEGHSYTSGSYNTGVIPLVVLEALLERMRP